MSIGSPRLFPATVDTDVRRSDIALKTQGDPAKGTHIMNEKLISGYAAFTTADEYGAAATGDTPATVPVIVTAVIFVSSLGSIAAHC